MKIADINGWISLIVSIVGLGGVIFRFASQYSKLELRVKENEKDIEELKVTQKEDVKDIKNRLNVIEDCVTSIQVTMAKMETLLTNVLGGKV